MNDAPRQTLREIVARHGQAVAHDARRCEGLLRDYSGEHRREVSVLVMAIEEHVPADLLAAPTATPRGVLLARLAQRLCDNLALSEGAARWSVGSWALALGVISDEELSELERQGPAAERVDAATQPAQNTARQTAAQTLATVAAVVVDARGGGDFVSIGEALKNAAPGSRILVRPGLYEEGVTIDRQVEIVGDGPPHEVVVRGVASSCVAMLAEGARVAGLTLRGAAEGFFAVDVGAGRLLLEDCDITSETLSCVAVHGAYTEPLIRRCRIHNGADSGLYFFDGAEGAVEECEVVANANVGLAVTGGASPAIGRTKIYGGRNAGVAVWGGGTCALDGCEIYGNRQAGVGVSKGGTITARACRIREGDNSGVFVHQGGDATLEDCRITGHREAEVAVVSRGQLTALRCEIQQGRGPGVFVREGGQALLQECTISDNAGAGVTIGSGSLAAVLSCDCNGNGGVAVSVEDGGAARVLDSDLSANRQGAWDVHEGAFVEGGDNVE